MSTEDLFGTHMSFHFSKSIKMIGYQIDIKVRHEMKNYKFLNKFHISQANNC
jgi:hypothetical protein